MVSYVYWAEDCSEPLEHFGILGQKWGRRRYQYEDGSLTPEGRRRYLKSGSYSKKHDIVLAPGSRTYRITTDNGTSNREAVRIYMTLNEKDANKYAGWYSRQLKANPDIKGSIYQKTYTVSSNTKIASEQKAQEILANSLKTNTDIKDSALKFIDEAKDNKFLSYSQKEYEKMANNLKTGNVTKKETDMLNRAIVLNASADFQKKYFSELSKHGYDGVIDLNDKYYNSYKTKNPAILFNVGKVTVESIKELSDKDIAKIANKEDLKYALAGIPKEVGVRVGLAAVVAAAALPVLALL